MKKQISGVGFARWVQIAAAFCILILVGMNASAAAAQVMLSPTALPDGQVGQYYDQTVTASGGIGPYTYALAGIPVTPPGLAYSSGRFSGTALQAAYTLSQ